MEFHCFVCRNRFEAEHFSLARVTIACPVCNTNLDIVQSLARAAGDTAGLQKRLSDIMEPLKRVCAKSKEATLAPIIDLAYGRIRAIMEGAA